MIPLRLSIEGLYSYQEPQTIDFTELSAAGLFGVFGATGSGKSSILEAITYAIYGETERMNNNDKRSYNMMNLKSNKADLDFEFLNFENKKFRVRRIYKRNSKQFHIVKPAEVSFYQWIDENWLPIEHPNPDEIVGLNYENFKRTIIIPQGQFKEFLELGGKDRSEMMMQIFNLHQYDLSENVNALNFQNEAEYNRLEGALSQFQAVNEEQIQTLTAKKNEAEKSFKEIEINYKNDEDRFLILKSLKDDADELENSKKELQVLAAEQPKIQDLLLLTNKYDLLEKVFKTLLSQENEYQNDLQNLSQQISSLEDVFKSVEESIVNNNEVLNTLTPRFNLIEKDKEKVNDLGLLLELKNIHKEIQDIQKRTKDGKVYLSNISNIIEQSEQTSKQLQNQIEQCSEQVLDTQLLLGISDWYKENKIFTEQIIKSKNELDQIQSQIKALNEKKIDEVHTAKAFLNIYEEKYSQIEQAIQQQNEIIHQFNLEQKFAQFAHELKSGSPCPLCGALDHPNIQNRKDVSEALNFAQVSLEKQLAEQKQLIAQKSFAEQVLEHLELLNEKFIKEEAQFNQLKKQQDDHQEKFIWEKYSAQDESVFLKEKEQSAKAEIEKKSLEQQLKDQLTSLEKDRKDLLKAQDLLQEIQKAEIEHENSFKIKQEQLKHHTWSAFEHLSIEEISAASKNLADEMIQIQNNFQSTLEKLQKLEQDKAATQAKISTLKSNTKERAEKLEQVEIQLQQALQQCEPITLAEVKNILKEQIDVWSNRQKIENFNLEYNKWKNTVDRLTTKLKNSNFDLVQYETLLQQLKEKKIQLEESQKNFHNANQELTWNQNALKEKLTLETSFSKIQKRRSNLNKMRNLFSAKGFVDFVSGFYLRQLCDQANIRFHKMSRNQLSLTVDEKNNFEIIDYLNEGKRRSVKTLSGGQSFQVSLSLALVLAESVQAKNKLKQNFFFIDEGFGTQDLEAVNVVFETLLQLQKENRIVGIISHVEELKERMPKALNIVKDEEKGSIIIEV